MNNIEFIQLENADEMLAAFPLIGQIYKDLSKEEFYFATKEMVEMNNFKMIIAVLNGEIVGVAGYFILRMLYCGKYIQISNFVVDEKKRSLGIGKKMMKYIENIGRNLGCHKFVLDSNSQNKSSHSLYFSQGFYIRGFHFMKDL